MINFLEKYKIMKIAIIPGIFFPEPGEYNVKLIIFNKLVEKRKNIDVLINKNAI